MEMLKKNPEVSAQESSEREWILCRWQRRPEQKLRMKESKKFFVHAFFMLRNYELFSAAKPPDVKNFHLSTSKFLRVAPDFSLNRWRHFDKRQQLELADKKKVSENGRIAGNRRQSPQWNFCAVDSELQIPRLQSEFSVFRVRISMKLVACACRLDCSSETRNWNEFCSHFFRLFSWTTLSSKKQTVISFGAGEMCAKLIRKWKHSN